MDSGASITCSAGVQVSDLPNSLLEYCIQKLAMVMEKHPKHSIVKYSMLDSILNLSE